MALSPICPTLLHQAATQLLRLPHERPLTVGQGAVLPLPGRPAGEPVSITDPQGKTRKVPSILRGNDVVLELPGLDTPGFHSVQAEGGPRRPLAVNPDPAESDIRPCAPAELAATLGDLPVRVIEEGEDIAASVRQTRVGRELWKILIAAALCALVLESIVAKRSVRRPRA
jgi:hypothetical protein